MMIKNKTLDGTKIGGKTWLVSKKSVTEYLKKTEGMSKNDPRRKLLQIETSVHIDRRFLFCYTYDVNHKYRVIQPQGVLFLLFYL